MESSDGRGDYIVIIYIFTFSLSSLLLYIYDKYSAKKYAKWIAVAAILIPAILAGCRAETIGTDVRTYVIKYYEEARSASGFLEYWGDHITSLLSEPLYFLVTYIISLFFEDFHWAMFGYSIITISFMFLGMKRCKEIFDTPIYAGMMVYYLLLYNYSLNLVRQCIAISVVFYAVTFLFTKEYKKFCIICAIAVLFHTSAIVGFVFLPMYLILRQDKDIALFKQIMHGIIFLAGLAFILAFGSRIVLFLIDAGIIRSWYSQYLSGGKYATSSSVRISLMSMIPQLSYLVLLLLHYIFVKSKTQKEKLFFIMNAFMVFLTPYAYLIARFASRVGYYFLPVLAVSLVNLSLCYNKRSKIPLLCMIAAWVFIIWFRESVILGYNDTVPYQFFWN